MIHSLKALMVGMIWHNVSHQDPVGWPKSLSDVHRRRDGPGRRSGLSASPCPGRRDDYCPVSRTDVGTSVPWASVSLFWSLSFMQRTIKMVSVLPNLPVELDIVLLRPSDQVMESDPKCRQQFRADFRVRRGHVLAWLRYLKANHPDYRYITISPDRVRTLPAAEGSEETCLDSTTLEIDLRPLADKFWCA